jgi:hypothetical protein
MKWIIVRPIIALLMGFIFLCSQFWEHAIFPLTLNLLALLTIISYLPYLRAVPRLLISSLLGLSVIIYMLQGEGLMPLMMSLSTNVGLICIFIFVPLLSIPIRLGQYLRYVEALFDHTIRSSVQLYRYLKLSLMSIGSVMNLGAVPLLHQLTETNSLQPHEAIRLKALGRGFALSFLWSPSLVLHYLIEPFAK